MYRIIRIIMIKLFIQYYNLEYIKKRLCLICKQNLPQLTFKVISYTAVSTAPIPDNSILPYMEQPNWVFSKKNL